jgi:hypothetical protein
MLEEKVENQSKIIHNLAEIMDKIRRGEYGKVKEETA